MILQSRSPEYFLPKEHLPSGFSYQQAYVDFVKAHPEMPEDLGPWGYDFDLVEASQLWSRTYSRPLVLFARAYDQDMLAFFDGMPGGNSRVFIANPWGHELDVEQTPYIIATLNDFEDWIWFAKSTAVDLGQAESPEGFTPHPAY